MGQVTVTINGCSYRLSCRDGEEPRVRELADHVDRKVDRLVQEFGQIAQERLMMMAAILVADELWDARDQLASLAHDHDEVTRAPHDGDDRSDEDADLGDADADGEASNSDGGAVDARQHGADVADSDAADTSAGPSPEQPKRLAGY